MRTVKVKDPNKPGDYIILNAEDVGGHELYDEPPAKPEPKAPRKSSKRE